MREKVNVGWCGWVVAGMVPGRKVDVRLPEKGNSNSHIARPVY